MLSKGNWIFRGCKRLWNSPTFTTWASFGSRTGGLVIVLPLVLTRLSTEEIVLYYLFSMLATLKMVANLGFTSTFARCIAFAMGGAKRISDMRAGTSEAGDGQPNQDLLKRVVETMRLIYHRLTLVLLLLYGVGGTYMVSRPIGAIPAPTHGWIAWAVVVAGTVIMFRGQVFNCFLQGTNNIALLRRWETILALGSVVSMAVVLLADGGILGVIVAHQVWIVLGVVRNWTLTRGVRAGWWRQQQWRKQIDRAVMGDIWPPAWRTGVAAAMSRGIVLLSGVIYARVATPADAAMLLLSLKLIDTVSTFSQAPFYSKLPRLASLRAQKRTDGLRGCAQRGMCLSYWAYLAGWVGLGVTGPWLLELIGANAQFPPLAFWALLGLAFFFERYGSMHIQVYSTTNVIISHKANAVAGAIYLAFITFGYAAFGIYAIPAGIMGGYLGFYCWYSAMHSYGLLAENFWRFERLTFLPVLVLGLAFTLYAISL